MFVATKSKPLAHHNHGLAAATAWFTENSRGRPFLTAFNGEQSIASNTVMQSRR